MTYINTNPWVVWRDANGLLQMAQKHADASDGRTVVVTGSDFIALPLSRKIDFYETEGEAFEAVLFAETS